MVKTIIFENDNPLNANGWTQRTVDSDQNIVLDQHPLREVARQRGGDIPADLSSMSMGRLTEALVSNPDAANMLRDGIRYHAFMSFNQAPTTWQLFTRNAPTDKASEKYLRDGTFGTVPRSPSGSEAPRVQRRMEGMAEIENFLHRMIVEITGDDIKFDRLGIIEQIANGMGRSAQMTIEARAYEEVTDTSNYTRSATAGDNDVGANQQTLAFSAANYETAYSVIATMRDRTSGMPAMLMPDTIICAPKAQWGIRRLLMSGQHDRVGGNTTNETVGTGTDNVYSGTVRRIIVSPTFGSNYEWALFDSSVQSFVYQELEAFQVFQQTAVPNNQAWLTLDVLLYLVRLYFGVGFVDDRAWFYSDTTSAPEVS